MPSRPAKSPMMLLCGRTQYGYQQVLMSAEILLELASPVEDVCSEVKGKS